MLAQSESSDNGRQGTLLGIWLPPIVTPRPGRARPGRVGLGRLRWAALLLTLGAPAVVLQPVTARADSISDKRDQAAQIAARLNADGRRIDQLSEQFDGAQIHADQVNAKLAQAKADLAVTDVRAGVLRGQLRAFAIGAYVRGGRPVDLHFVSGDVAMATVGRAYEELVVGNRADLLDALHQMGQDLSVQRAQLEADSREAQAAAAHVEALRKAASHAVADEQAVLARVNGELAGLVAQAQADHEAQLAAKTQAEMAARAVQQTASRQRPITAIPVVALPAALGHAAPPPAAPPTPPLPLTKPGPPVHNPPSPAPAPAPPVSGGAGVALATAAAQLGKPYQWGGAGPNSFDCSGLTMFAWAAAGVGLPHNAGAQYAVTTHIPLSALQPGDLVFFFGDLSHVGIYVGGGTMIHAPHSGAVVSYASIYAMGTTVILAGRVG